MILFYEPSTGFDDLCAVIIILVLLHKDRQFATLTPGSATTAGAFLMVLVIAFHRSSFREIQ